MGEGVFKVFLDGPGGGVEGVDEEDAGEFAHGGLDALFDVDAVGGGH